MELLPGPRVADLDYADDIALLEDGPQNVQATINHLVAEVTICGMHIFVAKCKVLFKIAKESYQQPIYVGNFRKKSVLRMREIEFQQTGI